MIEGLRAVGFHVDIDECGKRLRRMMLENAHETHRMIDVHNVPGTVSDEQLKVQLEASPWFAETGNHPIQIIEYSELSIALN